MSELVYNGVKNWFHNHEHKMLNKYIFRRDWESDFFCVSKSGYTIEVEVKMSRSDFLADFAKSKHKLFKAVQEHKQYLVERIGLREHWYTPELDGKKYATATAECTAIKIHDLFNCLLPNKYWFACPEGLIEEKDVPEYAGLFYVNDESNSFHSGYPVKTAPFIHKRKLNLPTLLFDKYHYGYQSQANEIETLKYKLWEANEKIKNLTEQSAEA